MALTKVSGGILQQPIDVGIITATSIQVGSGTTIHDTGIDLGSGNITSHNINSTGIVTSTGLDVNGNGDISGDLSVSGNVSIGGTLTYEDVTNIDSVGIITARDGIHVTGGSVGINTTVPGEKLDVLGTIRASAGTNQYMHMYPVAGAGYFDVRNVSSFPSIIFRQIGSGGTQERLRITSAGDVGIGTAVPVASSGYANLSIAKSSGGQLEFKKLSSGRTHYIWGDDNLNIGAAYNGGGSGDFIVNVNGNNERLRITSGGNVGIGTDTPYANNSFTSFSIGGSGKFGLIELNKSDGVAGSWIDTYGTNGDGNLRFTTAGTSGAITFWTGGSFTEKVRITSDGKLGIGVTSVDRLLHLKAASSTAYSGGSDTADYNFLKIENTTDNKSAGVFFLIGSNGEAAITATEVADGATDIAFQNRGGGVRSEKLRLDSQGRLGVGVIPKAFHANNKDVIQGSSGYVILGRGTSSLNICQNFYYDSSDAGKYIATGAATVYNQSNGSHTFYNASSGSADGSASLVERLQIQSDGRISIGAPAANALGALHIHANQGTDTALWIGDSSTNRYLAINEQGSTQNFNHINTRYNDNGIHAHYILDNPYATATGYGSQILFRGYNQETSAYLETSNEVANSGRATFRIRGRDNHGLDVRSTGEVTTTHASNIGYNTNAATNTRSLVYTSLDALKLTTSAADWYILKTFYPNKSGNVNMRADMFISSGTYYFSFRVREEGTDTIVFNAGDNGGYTAYENPSGQSGNVHSYKTYKWICPLIKAHKRYYIEMAATNAAGTNVNANASQEVFLKNLYIYSMSGGHSDATGSMSIQQSLDVSASTSYGGTTRAVMSASVNRDSLNSLQYFSGTESTFLGWFTTRAYNRYLDFEMNLSGSHMWFAQAYGYLYNRGQVCGSMISGYTYTNNQILNKYSHTFGNRGWYGSYRTSGGNLCLKFDSGGNGYSEGRIALFFGTHGPANPDWRVLRYRQNDTTSNIF